MTDAAVDWARVKDVFDAAVLLDVTARPTYVSRACGADAILRQHVEDLLRSHDHAASFLETPAAVLTDRDVEMLAGRTIGTYRIEALLGAGGMGEVYRAHDTRLDRPVAIKLLSRQVVAEPDRLRRFHAEARAASSLNHPNILVIHDFGDVDARPFIVSEFVEGDTLRRRLEPGPVPLREALAIAIQIAGALAAAHQRGLVHRDIKPENVIVRPDGYVKVLDFGLAKLLAPPVEDGRTTFHTASGIVMGTPHYMSPEQAEGREVDGRSDLFSLGVVVYELVTGTRPFTGDTRLSVLTSILRDAPMPVTEHDRTLPPDLDGILRRCLEKDRDRRYASATALRADLETLERSLRSDGLGTRGRPPGTDRGRSKDGGAESLSLAVLPFANAGGDPEAEYLSDGITESLINRLSKIPSLRIVPRSTAFRYKGTTLDATKAGRQLRVTALLTGKVLQRGDSLSVQAELVDVEKNAQLWGERFVRRASDILAVEEEIAGHITESLRLTLTGEERARLGTRQTQSTEAYHLYLKGHYYWSKRTPPNLKKCVAYFEQAIAVDAGYAPAYAGLADAFVVLSVFDAGDSTDLLSKAKAACRKALEIDPGLPQALAEEGIIAGCLDRDWDAAEDAFHRALQRKPEYWLARTHFALTLAAQGRFDDAIAEVRRGLALEPLSLVVQHHAAWVHLLARRYDEAIGQCRTAIDMDPTFPMAHLWMGISLEQQGQFDDAIASLERAVTCMGGASIGVAAAAHAYAVSGRTAEARERLEALRHLPGGRQVQHYGVGLVHAALGEADEALRWLEQAHAAHSFWWAYWGHVDPRLDVLRPDPRFQTLLRKLRLEPGGRGLG